jgi:cytochrome c oxidase subunit 4
MSGHVLPVRTYLAVFFALLVLTAVTTAVAFLDLGPLNTVAALGIALVKATVVALYFMHVKYSPRLVALSCAVGLVWLGLLFALTIADYDTRGLVPGW